MLDRYTKSPDQKPSRDFMVTPEEARDRLVKLAGNEDIGNYIAALSYIATHGEAGRPQDIGQIYRELDLTQYPRTASDKAFTRALEQNSPKP